VGPPNSCPVCGATSGEGASDDPCPRCLLGLGLSAEDDPEKTASGLFIGQRVGPYEVVSRLGSGGMGEVYRGHDARLGRDVALKVLSAGFADDPDRLERFRREARLLAALNHPHIGAIYGLEESRGSQCLVLELVEGSTLAEHLGEDGLPLERVLEICGQIADGLEAAHERGIVHRDLKPSNVMVTPRGQAKILDFGIAWDTGIGGEGSELTEDGALVGTIPYMSPEQIRRQRVDARSDIWAFGCLLFEMLSGGHPFRRKTPADTMSAILESPPMFELLPPETPAPVRSLLDRCLHKGAGSRLADIGEARDELREARSALRSPAAESGRWRVRHLATALGLLGSLLLLTATQSGAIDRLMRFAMAGIYPSLSDGGTVVGVAALTFGILVALRGLARVLRRRVSTSSVQAALASVAAVYLGVLLLALATGRRYTAGLLLVWCILVWIAARSRWRPALGRWTAALLPVGILAAAFVVEGWWLAHATEVRDHRLDVYVVLPFERLNDEENAELLDVTEHYRATLATVFGDLDSVRVMPERFEPALLESYPPQCSYRRVRQWLADSDLAPDVVLCSTVDLFESEGEPGVMLVSTIRHVRAGVMNALGGRIKQTGSYADIEWLALRTCFRLLQVLRQAEGLELADEDETLIRRRILERYVTFLHFREQDGAAVAVTVEAALEREPVAEELVEQALEEYSSPIDIEAYASRHQAARSALATRALKN
jgi:hypothetical protein